VDGRSLLLLLRLNIYLDKDEGGLRDFVTVALLERLLGGISSRDQERLSVMCCNISL
jgi:hypothetical protein